ncbi:MAG: DinB family protein [bacterium]
MSGLSRPQRWTTRTFPNGLSVELAPNVHARLSGAVPRVMMAAQLASAATSMRVEGWTVAEHIGHLGDLEQLALRRLDDYDANAATLSAADMSNRETHEAGHNGRSLEELASRFTERRSRLLDRLGAYSAADWGRSAMHPRLQQPMRLIDLMVFVAEHDDHHLAEIAWLLASR